MRNSTAHRTYVATALCAVFLGVTTGADPAGAACTRLGFSVNDYGKDGPTKDAKELLDKYIAKWAKEHNIAKYTTGKKDVSCELFLNFILFDEHTCKAEASVCWDGPAVAGPQQAKGDATTPEAKPEKPKVAKSTAPAGNIDAKADKPVKSQTLGTHVETGSTAKASTSADNTPKSNTAAGTPPAAPAAEVKSVPEEKPAGSGGQ